MAELAGVMVGNYFLLECLRSEGMVETYLARPTTSGGYDVYLRLFRPRFPDPLSFQEHFASEVRKVWRCRHPHIQPLSEFGEGDGVLYTTVRASSGALTLERVLEKQGSKRLPLRLVVQLMTQICEALQYAHEQEIVHGNLQPSSILLDVTKQTLVTNFGLHRAYQEGDPTVAQVEEGNAAYLAPEQVVGMLRPASDIYALGVLLYRLLSGKLPYEGESAGEIAMQHTSEPIPSLRALRPDLPAAIDVVMRMALAKSPDARFSTPQALAEALVQALAHNSPPVSATPPPVRRIAVNPRRTQLTWPRALSLMALTLILVGLGSTLYLFPFTRLVLSAPGSPLRSFGQPGSFTIFFPGLRPTPSSPASGGDALAQATPGQQAHGTPTPGRQGMPTATSSPGIQQSPIVFPVTPTAAPPTASPPRQLVCVPGTLKIDGSFYLAPLLQQVGLDYQTFCPNWQLSLEQKGCRAGLAELRQGQIDLAASDLSVKTATGLSDYPIAAMLYAVVVSPDVQISGLSSQQLQAIYQGRVTNWRQLGGPHTAISVLLHPSGDPLNTLFQHFVLNGVPMRASGVKLSKMLTPEQIAQKVASTPGAISFVPLAVAGTAPVRVLALNRVAPTPQNVQQGTYPFWSIEHLYTSAASAQAQAYIQFFQTTGEGNRFVQAGAVPLSTLPPAILSSHLPGPMISA
ncbi:MAG TPA: substrate-binding domain-containing protein [Ktedonobacteraceae bacterium]|nr:substrate-binding domain-containing protein [Ktedonobacteraceae bacterium]